jgi:PBP1b-binding outer membrane lipoprotein LpoB
MKKRSSYIVLIITLLVVSGCSQENVDKKAKKYVLEETSNKAIQYMKTVKNKEIVLVSHQFEKTM